MKRTTLDNKGDALQTAVANTSRHRLSPAKVVNERLSTDRPLVFDEQNGLHVVRLRRRSPKVTAELVNTLRNELP